MLEDLARQIRDRQVVLFAGAGLSMSLGLPSWGELIAHIAEELGYDPGVLVAPGADYMQIAEYYKIEKNSIGPLRSWMDRKWNIDDDKIKISSIHKQIIDLDFPLIYTTNYDRNIEKSFELHGKKFHKIVNMLDVASADPSDTHIVKFHGDFDSDESLVLTESDYFERLNFESPLDIKFRADVLGRSILFIGYSLSDLNLRILLYRLQKMWESSGFSGRRPQSYILLPRPDPVQESVLETRGVRAIVADVAHPSEAIPDLFDRLIETITKGV